MEVTFAAPQDKEGWMSLLELVRDHFPGLDLKDYRLQLKTMIQQNQAIVCKNQGEVVGALAFFREEPEIAFLAVHPHNRRAGIAKDMLTFLLDQFPDGTAIRVVTYRSQDEKGAAARSFYESFGFQPGKLLTVYDCPCEEYIYRNIPCTP